MHEDEALSSNEENDLESDWVALDVQIELVGSVNLIDDMSVVQPEQFS